MKKKSNTGLFISICALLIIAIAMINSNSSKAAKGKYEIVYPDYYYAKDNNTAEKKELVKEKNKKENKKNDTEVQDEIVIVEDEELVPLAESIEDCTETADEGKDDKKKDTTPSVQTVYVPSNTNAKKNSGVTSKVLEVVSDPNFASASAKFANTVTDIKAHKLQVYSTAAIKTAADIKKSKNKNAVEATKNLAVACKNVSDATHEVVGVINKVDQDTKEIKKTIEKFEKDKDKIIKIIKK